MTRLQLTNEKYQFETEKGRDCFVMGRLGDCDFIVSEPSVSRMHAEVFKRPAGWCVRDLDSRHGIWVNGRKVEMSRLKDGDTLRLGDLFLDVKLIRESPISSARVPKATRETKEAPAGERPRPVIRIGQLGGATTMMRVPPDEQEQE